MKTKPTHHYADEFRLRILAPNGVKRIAKILHCFVVACIMFVVILPFFHTTFEMPSMFTIISIITLCTSAILLHLLARGFINLKRWALYVLWAITVGLLFGFICRIDFAQTISECILPILNICILLYGFIYLIRPRIRLRFTR